MNTTLPDSIFQATAPTPKSRTYPPMAECSECGRIVDCHESRLVIHTGGSTWSRGAVACRGSGNAIKLGHAEGRLVATILMSLAQSRGLDWIISYEDADGERHAFRLVRDGLNLIEPAQVIGETEEDARDCISLAAEMKPKKKKK